MASNDGVEVTPRHLDGHKRETPADAKSGKKWSVAVVVALATIVLLLGLKFLLGMQRSSLKEDQTASGDEHLEHLQQCQKDVSDLKLMVQSVTQDSRCRLCPDGWLWWKSRCYFFSIGLQENRQWNESAEFCQQHNSSLVVIKDSAEMDFIQEEMSKFPYFPFVWVGLTDSQQEGRWLWWDGTEVQHHFLLTVQWDTDDRDCADLRGDGLLFAAECDVYGPWVCKRES